MKMTKRIRATFLALCLLSAALASCRPAGTGGDETTLPPETTAAPAPITTAPPESTASTEDKEKLNTLTERAMTYLNEDNGLEHFGELIKVYCTDYIIDSIDPINDFAASLNYIGQRDGATVMSYKNGLNTFSFERDGYILRYLEEAGKSGIDSIQSVGGTGVFTPSIFYDFGVDISYFLGSDTKTDIPEPKLEASMIIPSEDYTSCTFSDEYLNLVLDLCAATSEYSGADLEKLRESGRASGSYSLADDAVSFDIEFVTPDVGKMTMSVSTTQNEKDGISYRQRMTMNVVSNGIRVPTTVEVNALNIKYEGKDSVSGRYELLVTAEAPIESAGFSGTATSISQVVLGINSRDLSDPRVSMQSTVTSTVSMAGQTQTSSVTTVLNISHGDQLYYTMAQDSTQVASVLGRVRFGKSAAEGVAKLPAEAGPMADDVIRSQSAGTAA